MSKFYDDTLQGLLEAVQIEKGELPLKQREDMPGKTYYVAESDSELIDKLVEIRKSENISQSDLAKMTGSTQQAISRFEKKNHNVSMNMYYNIVNALGYEIQLVKRDKKQNSL